jgi:cytochrome d ubiquinol oxidase subunit II
MVLLGGICLAITPKHAPQIFQRLQQLTWSIPWLLTSTVAMGWCLWAIHSNRWKTARRLAVCIITLVILGWAISQFPYMIYPVLTVSEASAPTTILRLTCWILAIGGLFLIPSFLLLYQIFNTNKDEMAQ